jgi:hypothetical protein
MLIIGVSSIGAFLLTILLKFYPCYYLALLFYPCTCWVPTISVLNLAIFTYYSNLLLRSRRWTGNLRRRVLGYVLPRLSFLWSYEVFRCSDSLRVVIVFRDITYVTIILYSWYLIICEHFLSVCVEQLILSIHMMSTWFWHNNWIWQSPVPLITATSFSKSSCPIKPCAGREKAKPNSRRKNHVESRSIASAIYLWSLAIVSHRCCDFSGKLKVNSTWPVSSPCQNLSLGLYGSKIGGL